MTDDPVPKECGGHAAELQLVDVEIDVFSWLPCARREFLMQVPSVGFPAGMKAGKFADGDACWISPAESTDEFLYAHARLLEDTGERADLNLCVHGHHATGLVPLHHHMAAVLAGFLEAQQPESLAAFLPANNRQLGHGKLRNRLEPQEPSISSGTPPDKAQWPRADCSRPRRRTRPGW